MNTDYFCTQGREHSMCQDYAIAGKKESGVRYAILSDGCSGKESPGQPGSPFTEIGARLLVRSAYHYVGAIARMERRAEAIGRRIVRRASHQSYLLDLPDTALDATLLIAACDPEAYAAVLVAQYGDGVVAARKRGGAGFDFWSVNYSKGMPYYLSYQLEEERRETILREEQTVSVQKNGEPADPRSLVVAHEYTFNRSDYDLVLVLSDGVESFQDKLGRPVPVVDVLTQIFAIHSFAGSFLQRRCRRLVDKCPELGWRFLDDFSVAGIYLDELKP